jgi:hypothetical protein
VRTGISQKSQPHHSLGPSFSSLPSVQTTEIVNRFAPPTEANEANEGIRENPAISQKSQPHHFLGPSFSSLPSVQTTEIVNRFAPPTEANEANEGVRENRHFTKIATAPLPWAFVLFVTFCGKDMNRISSC